MGSDLIKDGTGTLTLTAPNTYDGDTIVNGGTLLVNGSYTGMGDATVNNGGTLGGTGIISGVGHSQCRRNHCTWERRPYYCNSNCRRGDTGTQPRTFLWTSMVQPLVSGMTD